MSTPVLPKTPPITGTTETTVKPNPAGENLNTTDETQQSVVIKPEYYDSYTFFANETKGTKASEERLKTDANAYTIDPRTGDGFKLGNTLKNPNDVKDAIDRNIKTIVSSGMNYRMQMATINELRKNKLFKDYIIFTTKTEPYAMNKESCKVDTLANIIRQHQEQLQTPEMA